MCVSMSNPTMDLVEDHYTYFLVPDELEDLPYCQLCDNVSKCCAFGFMHMRKDQ